MNIHNTLEQFPILPEILQLYGGFLLQIGVDGSAVQLVQGLESFEQASIERAISQRDFYHIEVGVGAKNAMAFLLPEEINEKHFSWVVEGDQYTYVAGVPKEFLYTRHLNLLPVGILKLDKYWIATHCNSFLEKLIGVNQNDLLNRAWLSFCDNEQIVIARRYLTKTGEDSKPFEYEQEIVTPLGRRMTMSVSIVADYSLHSKQVQGYTMLFNDVSEKAEAKRKEIYAANHDMLTDLPNRRALNKFIAGIVSRQELDDWILLFIDLDGFKQINDIYGHGFGDKVLTKISQLIKEFINNDEFACRNGGDEFLILLKTTHSTTDTVIGRAEAFASLFSTPLCIDNHPIKLKISMGIVSGRLVTSYPPPKNFYTTQLELWFTVADSAMYHAKNVIDESYFEANLPFIDSVFGYLNLKRDIEECVINKHIQIVFQPIFLDNNIHSVEALARFSGPLKGQCPELIIKNATSLDVYMQLLNLMTEEALVAYASLITQLHYHNVTIPKLNINLELAQFTNRAFLNRIADMCDKQGIKRSNIYIEISERKLMSEEKDLVDSFYFIKELGFFISMDDFGAGFSNIQRLISFDFDQIKLDKVYFNNIEQNPKNRVALSASVTLANGVEAACLAEGIETRAQLLIAKEHGIHLFQGFYLAKPMTIEHVVKKLLNGPDNRVNNNERRAQK